MRPTRILHVLGAMNRGGVETWLMHVLRHLDRKSFVTDLLVHTDEPAAYDNEVLGLGSRILRCPHTGNPLLYAKRFLQLVRDNGPFDVLHSHVHYFSGFVLALGRAAGIPVRIAHSHNNTSSLTSSLVRTAYLESMRWLIAENCTQGLAASRPAAGALFGPKWQNDARFQVLYCGIDPGPCSGPFNPVTVRAEFGFSSQDLVFGHVGRFDPQKNHQFYLETATEIRRLEPRAKFLLVGEGPLRPKIEAEARALGLNECTVFTGARSDVLRLMTNGMDLLLFPSLYEGLGLVLLEAQAVGLTSLVSERIPREVVIHPALVRHLPLSIGAREWARIASDAVREPRFDPGRALDLFTSSPFGIDRCVQRLGDIFNQHIFPALPEHSKQRSTIA